MTLFARSPDGLRIAYDVEGEGAPVLLVHGFASSRVQNWRATGWYKVLADSGFRVIAMDCRGHGDSDKPHDPAFYSYELMSGDVLAVAAAAGAPKVDVIGYSMGGHLVIRLLMTKSSATGKAVIAGVGETYLRGDTPDRFAIADALLAPDPERITDPVAKMFRLFAGQSGKDRVALAACMRGKRPFFTAGELAHAARPALVVCGGDDSVSGRPEPLARALGSACAVVVPGRDHMSAVGDKRTKAVAVEFLGER